MADSENSRTLSANTRLNILSHTTDFLASMKGRDLVGVDADPAVAKWLEWYQAHREFALRCLVQQRLEAQLTHAVGFPSIKFDVPGEPEPVVMQSEADIEYWLKGDDLTDARDKAKKALAAQLREWNAADEILGYTKAREVESVACDRDFALAAELWDMPAQSTEGAIAKLHVVLSHGIASPESDEFPWPPLESVMNDLMQMVKGLTDLLNADKAVVPILEVTPLRARRP